MTPEDIRAKYSLRDASVVRVLQYFADSYFHPELKAILVSLRTTAFEMVDLAVDGPELVVGLRRLVEAKDCFVRHFLVTHNFLVDNNDKPTS